MMSALDHAKIEGANEPVRSNYTVLHSEIRLSAMPDKWLGRKYVPILGFA